LVEQSSQGTFIPEGHHDILATAIGRPEHPRCMRAVGSGVGIHQYFGDSSSQSLWTHSAEYEEKLTQRKTEQITERVMRQFEQHFGGHGNAPQLIPQPKPFVPPTGRSRKGSCSCPAVPGDDADNTHRCELYVLHGIGKTLVPCGTKFEATTVLHGMELADDEVKVTVEEVIIPDALVPVPIDEVYTVAHAFQSFLTWPKDLVGSISDPSVWIPKLTL